LEDEAALAALLGHEIGHVCARHTARQVSKGLLADAFLAGASVATSAAGFEGATDLVQGLGGLSAGALLARYSRDNEREADALGMAYMTRTGYSPEGMVQLMEMLQRSGRNQASAIELMFATHPMSTERLDPGSPGCPDHLSGSSRIAGTSGEVYGCHRIPQAG
jgi:beta-barrel assembly-enhancing protease